MYMFISLFPSSSFQGIAGENGRPMAWQSDVDERLLHSGTRWTAKRVIFSLDLEEGGLRPLIRSSSEAVLVILRTWDKPLFLLLIFCTGIYTGVDICQGYSHVIVDKVKYTITKERSKVCPMRSPS
ncbi:unnamed protein product [Musa acuminata subsp. burmannicoides]